MSNPHPAPFGARERAILTGELLDELSDRVYEYSRMAQLTVVEVIGVLECLKHQLLLEQDDPDFEDDDNEH